VVVALIRKGSRRIQESKLGMKIKSHDSYIAITLMLGSSLFMASVAATVKYLSDDIPVPQIVFFRNFTGSLLVLSYLAKKKINPLGNNRRILALRGMSGTIGVVMYFYAISNLDLADAVMLNRTSPFFVILLSATFLHEPLRKLQIPALIIAMVGIVCISRPRLDVTFIPAAIGLLSAVFAGTAYTCMRHLRHTDDPPVIVFYFTMVSSLFMLPIMALGYWETPTLEQFAVLLVLGLLGLGGQHLMTTAYRHAQAGEVAIYGYSNVIFAMVLGVVLWQEIPQALSFMGAGAIITAAYLNARSGMKNRSLPPNSPTDGEAPSPSLSPTLPL